MNNNPSSAVNELLDSLNVVDSSQPDLHAHIAVDERVKAYSYIRFSTKRQSTGDSMQRQLDRSRDYAAEHNLNLQEKSFDDLGVSAFDGSNVTRGALSAFIKAVEKKSIDRGSYLLVENLDRLSRSDVIDAMSLLANLVKLGIRIVTLIDGRILDEESVKEPMNLMWAVMVFVRANEESETKSDRIKKAHKRKRDNHSKFAFGQGPGWLRPNPTKTGWEVIPEKAASVIKVFESVAAGKGSTFISRLANDEKWPVPGRAQNWHKTLPHKLIHNRRVLGELEPQVKSGNTRRPTGDCWLNYYPAIVSVKLFNDAQAAAMTRRKLPKRRDTGYHNIFQGFLRCGHCGATLSRKAKNSLRNSPGYALYVCADRDRGLTACPNWNARELETAIIPPLMTCVAAEILEGNIKSEALQALDAERAALIGEKKAIQNLMAVIEQSGGSDTLAGRIRELESDATNRRARIKELSAIAYSPESAVWEEDVDAAIANALKAVRDITELFMDKRTALHQSLSRVVCNLWVWPGSHASVQMHDEQTITLLQFAKKIAKQATLKGKFEVKEIHSIA